ncbi:hypothetical protein [Mariprofundus ferrooxydans]|uniref:hypothetical protein n=1 Tax=Mariprofundus ferrooxydans TaxID=314344 RepID=UPI00142FAD60|nr:hypothetical protein [Mariprofundus ferrooxydans]
MTTELVTQIIILATALVGLYKAATFHRGKSVTTNGEPSKAKENESTFSALFDLVGVLLFMLAFPAFIWAFSWITSNMTSSSSSEQEYEIAIPFTVNSESTTSELMYVSALRIPNIISRGESLTKVVTHSLANKEYRVAILAASAIPNIFTRGKQLERIVDEINKTQISSSKDAPNKALQPTVKSGG